MAEVNKYVGGRKIEDFIGDMPGLTEALGEYAFEIKAFADVRLIEARDFSESIGRTVNWDSFVEIQKSGSGHNKGFDVILNDELGDGAAWNIEKGRKVEWFDPVTGLPMGAMQGLFILEEAVTATADRHRGELL